jgi:hypothetical protein
MKSLQNPPFKRRLRKSDHFTPHISACGTLML